MAQRKRKSFAYKTFTIFGAIGHIFKSPIVLSWVLAITGLIALTAMSVPKLRSAQISAADIAVSFENPPVWIHDSVLRELEGVARTCLAKTIVGREGLIDTSSALLATGWFTNVSQVRWIDENKATVSATFLVPYARIQDRSGVLYVDVQGRRLPKRQGVTVKPNYHFITLVETSYERPQRPGLQWNGEDVHAGIQLLNLIYDQSWATQIKNINLSRWPNKTLLLETDKASTFIWGSTPQNERPLEALANQKIERLNHINAKHGRIDQGISAQFDLTHPRRVIRK